MARQNVKRADRGSSDPTSLVITLVVGGLLYYTGVWLIDYMWDTKEDRRSEYVESMKGDQVVRDDMGYDVN